MAGRGSPEHARVVAEQVAGGPPTTRVVILGVYGMLLELLKRALARRQGVQVLVLEAAAVTEVPPFDLAIVDLPNLELPDTARRMLEAASRPKLLGLRDDGRQGYLYELRPDRSPLGELSEALLAEVLDSVAPTSSKPNGPGG